MEDKNPNPTQPITPTPETPTPVVPQQPIEQPKPTQPTQAPVNPTPPPASDLDTPKKSFNKLILIVGGVIVAIVMVVAMYFMALKNQSEEPTNTEIAPVKTVQVSPTVTPEPTIAEEPLENIDIGDPDTDIKILDEDVQAL